MKAAVPTALLLPSNLDVIADILMVNNEVNVLVSLIFLWTFFTLFMLFNIFFSFAAVLLITEASMLTLIFLLIVSITNYFPNLTADILNLLNASAMEAIVGITIVFVHQKSWKSRYTNGVDSVLESISLFWFYIFIIIFGHVSWGIFRLVTGVTYYWIKSVFKSVAKYIKILFTFTTYVIKLIKKIINFILMWCIRCLDCSLSKYNYNLAMNRKKIINSQKHNKYIEKILIAKYSKKEKYNNRFSIPYKIKIKKYSNKKINFSFLEILKQRFLFIYQNININLYFLVKIFKYATILSLILLFLLAIGIFYIYYVENYVNKPNISDILFKDYDLIKTKWAIVRTDLLVNVKNTLNSESDLIVNLKVKKIKNINHRLSNFENYINSQFIGYNPNQVILDLNQLLTNIGFNVLLNYRNGENYFYFMNLERLDFIKNLQAHTLSSLGKDNNIGNINNLIENIKLINNVELKWFSNIKNFKISRLYFTETSISENLENLLGNIVKKNTNSSSLNLLLNKIFNFNFLDKIFKNDNELSINKKIIKTTTIGYSGFSTHIYDLPKLESSYGFKSINKWRSVFLMDMPNIFVISDIFSTKNIIKYDINNFKIFKLYKFFDDYKKILNIFEILNSVEIRPIIIKFNIKEQFSLTTKEEYISTVNYSNINEKIEWSGKNWDSLQQEYSKLLPWYDNIELEDDIVDTTEISYFLDEIMLSEYIKINKLNADVFGEQINEKYINSIINHKYYLNSFDKNNFTNKLNLANNILLNMENGYTTLFKKYDEYIMYDKVQIGRAVLPYPINSPRTMNSFSIDNIENTNGSVYSKGASETPKMIKNIVIQNNNDLSILNLNYSNKYIENSRIFSYSNLIDFSNINDFGAVFNIFGFNSLKKQINTHNLKASKIFKNNIKNKKYLDVLNLDTDELDFDIPIKDRLYKYRFRMLNGIQNSKNIKLLQDGNIIRNKIRFGNRTEDILNNRKIVEDRMIQPIQNLLNIRAKEKEDCSHLFIRIPNNKIIEFIEKNNRMRDGPDADGIFDKIESQPFDLQLQNINSSNLTGKIIFEDDLELDIDMLRTSSKKPHSIYGLLWDEYLHQNYSNNLKFLNFNNNFTDEFINKNIVKNFNYRDNLELALSFDSRYKFMINDEIKNTIIPRIIPKYGYFSELDNINEIVLDLSNKNKILSIKSHIYRTKNYKKN